MKRNPNKDADISYINRIKKHMKQGSALIEEGLSLLEDIEDNSDKKEYEYMSECFTTAAKNLDKARAMATELGNYTSEEYAYKWRESNKGKPTDTDLSAVTYDITQEKEIIRIISNYRCPNFRACDVAFYRYAKDIKDTFKRQTDNQTCKPLKECYMVFLHHYIDTPMYARDVDNYFEKPLSDAIAECFVIGGDGPKNVRRCSIAVADVRNFTEVFLIPFSVFPAWIEDFHIECEYEKLLKNDTYFA